MFYAYLKSICIKKHNNMIIVSDKATARINELREQEGRSTEENIRVSVKGGFWVNVRPGL